MINSHGVIGALSAAGQDSLRDAAEPDEASMAATENVVLDLKRRP